MQLLPLQYCYPAVEQQKHQPLLPRLLLQPRHLLQHPPAAAPDDSSSSTSFTNKYGTSTTLCAHTGCNNYIASSGDTNCCTVHSNRCLNCNKYIDEDAVYCMSCLSGSITKSQSSSKSSSSSSSSSSSTAGGPGKCKYKVGSTFVCNKNATNGNFCKEHYDYLNDAYNSLFG